MNMMKHRSLALCLTLVCLAGAGPDVFAQDYPPVPVTISRSKVSMHGKSYYAHIVLERQTIYGIAKAYGVTEEDLYAANPMLAQEGLRSGTVLYVPVVSEQKSASKQTKTEKPVVVKEQPAPKEPEVKKEKPAEKEKPVVVKEKKPVETKEKKPAEKKEKPVVVDTTPAPIINEDGFLEHTVKWFEDIYDVAKAYDVTAEQIMAANGLKSSRISKRQTLLIPVTDKAKESIAAKVAALKKPAAAPPVQAEAAREIPVEAEAPVVAQANPVTEQVVPMEEAEKPVEAEVVAAEPDDADDGILNWLTGKGSADIALILPFNASGKPSESNMDFYSGVLLALRQLEKEGVKATLNVFDLQAGVPSSYDLGKNDFVLGPITASDLTTILGVTGGQVPVISPLDQRAGDLADTHRGFIQAPSSAASQYAELAAWAAEDRAREDKIILVTETTSNGSTAPAIGVRQALVDAGTPFETVSWTQAQGRSLPASLTSVLTKSGVNRIIVASEKEAFVSDIVRNLSILLGRGYKIAMYAPSRVRTFETVDSSLYHQDHLHICSPYFADYETSEVKAFVRAYRALYRTEPSQFAFQGYDLAHFFAKIVAKYGNGWTRALTRTTETGLHTDFRFEKTPSGSFRNTGIRRIVYDTDYSTYLVK